MHRYVLIVQGLARRGNLPEHELVGIIIDGLKLPNSDANLLASCAPTIADLKTALNRHESRIMLNLKAESGRFRQAAPYAQPGNRIAPPAVRSTPSTGPHAGSNTSRAPARPDTRLRCENCRRQDHAVAACPYPKRPDGAYFRCWQPGHSYRNCKNNSFTYTYRTSAAAMGYQQEYVENIEKKTPMELSAP